MKLRHLCALGALLFAPAAHLAAQAFNSGSTGAYGAINVTTDTTLQIPPDGKFHCTTINVAAGKTLRFNRNSLDTPVYLLATGSVTITGTINVSGADGFAGTAYAGVGGPGGFGGGYAGIADAAGGSGLGPGGGASNITYGSTNQNNVAAAFARAASLNTNVYGNAALIPLIGGSGGGGYPGNPGAIGGGGGGAILIASNVSITMNNGAVEAHGGAADFWAGAGSGGAIRLVAPMLVGPGTLNCNYGINRGGYPASPGRVRCDCPDVNAYRSFTIVGVVSAGTFMQVFPATVPSLSFIEAAGEVIAEGTVSAVEIALPAGSSGARTMKLRARNLTGTVPIRVRVAPDSGAAIDFDTTLDMAGNAVAETTVNITLPVGTVSHVSAWTR